MIDELDIVRRDEAVPVRGDFFFSHATIEFWCSIRFSIRALFLPRVIDFCRPRDLRAVEHDFLFLLALHGILAPCAQIEEQNFSAAVAERAAMIRAAALVLMEDPERDADVRRDEEVAWQDDDGFDLVIFDETATDVRSIAVIEGAIGKKESSDTIERFQMIEDVKDPRIVRIARRRRPIVRPARIMRERRLPPIFEIEGRIRHDVVEVQATMQIVRE